MKKNPKRDAIEEIQTILFEINGINFGVDIEQISEILEVEQAEEQEQECVLITLHNKRPSEDGSKPLAMRKVLKIVGTEAAGLAVDRVVGTREINLDQLRLFPPFLGKYTDLFPFLGIILGEQEFGYLVDCYRLFDVINKRSIKD